MLFDAAESGCCVFLPAVAGLFVLSVLAPGENSPMVAFFFLGAGPRFVDLIFVTLRILLFRLGGQRSTSDTATSAAILILFAADHERHDKAITIGKEQQTKRNEANQWGGQKVNSHVDDIVLWSRVDTETPANKLVVKRISPYRVIDTRINSSDIEHLIAGAKRNVHAPRLKLYADSSLDINEDILEHVANQDIYLTVENLNSLANVPCTAHRDGVGLDENRLSLNRSNNAKELDDTVDVEFTKVEDDNWERYYRRVQKYEDMYAAALEDCPLVSEVDEAIEKDGYDSSGGEEEQLKIEEEKGDQDETTIEVQQVQDQVLAFEHTQADADCAIMYSF
ncbi:unnamed protein product [Phytophthora fragariaefolia]|uniref:Unnamed protein product n=1 Tax=Phytophthora fragariaefolia TaxID=1490495 RepID=A0A9W6Y1Y0_9STRA|nr:unnamed protein product [Phytophthora fragariaefolia]